MPPLDSTLLNRPRAILRGHPDRVALAVVVLAAVAIRLAFSFRSPVFLLHDSGSYYLPAHDLVNGLGFDLSIRRTPGYPWFLAGTIALFGEELGAVAFAQHLLGVGAAALVYVLGSLLFGRVAGLLAGLLTALDGTLLVSEQYVMPEALLLVLLLATFVATTLAIRRDSRRLWLLSGLLLGAAILCKPVAQVMIPVIPLVLLLSRGFRRAVAPTALLLVGLAVVVLPWAIRNWAVHGTLTTAGALGQTLIARTAKHDHGFRYHDPRATYADRREAVARQTVQSGINQRLSDGVIYRRVQERLRLTDAETNAYMRDLALGVIRDQPAYYLQGTLWMTWQLLVGEVERLRTDWKTQNARLSRDEWEERVEHLLARPSPAHQNDFPRAEAIVGLYQPAALGPLLPFLALLGTLGALLSPSRRPAALPGLAALALLGVSAALDGPVPRYRYPADPLIALAAMGGVMMVARVIADRLRVARALTREADLGDPRSARAATSPTLGGERGHLPPLPPEGWGEGYRGEHSPRDTETAGQGGAPPRSGAPLRRPETRAEPAP